MQTIDVLIVGGGTAGCILAARLSEAAEVRVVLLEAGADTPAGAEPADVRDTFPRAFANPGYFWPGITAVMRNGDAPRALKQPRILGGGSSVMGLWALRGVAADFDGWQAAGAHGWGYRDVLPYFRKLERDHDYAGIGDMHGADGPIPVRRVPRTSWPGFVAALDRAAEARQIGPRDDINGGDDDGFYPLPISASLEQRASSPSQYLTAKVRARPNLEIRTDVLVRSILLDGRRATGVEIARPDGAREALHARRVVLSAGGIHSPAILMRSGIGAAAELAAAGITPAVEAGGVGRNLQNHLYVHMGALIRAGQRQSPRERAFAMSVARISSGQPGAPRGDLLLSVMARTMARSPGNQLGVVGGHLYAPASRGRVTLSPADPFGPPVIDFRYLDDDLDRARLMQIARLACDLLEDPVVAATTLETFMLPASPPLGMLNGPGLVSALACAGVAALPLLPAALRRELIARNIGRGRFLDDLGRGERFEALVLDSYTSMFHPAGTCAIGSVVDPGTRVIGMDGLHVVDASIMPTVPRANTNLPTSMVAERAAALIAADLKAAA